jgi:protein-tyrosine phosphatase
VSHLGLPAAIDAKGPYRVCFVCTGNICRSPMAEVVLRHLAATTPASDGRLLAEHLAVSSIGTGPWHEGEPMDGRARRALERAGYVDHGHVARHLSVDLLAETDLLVALDRRHMQTLRSMGRGRVPDDRVVLLRAFDPAGGGPSDVEDPYYGDVDTFAECLAVVEPACRGLAAALAAHLGRR